MTSIYALIDPRTSEVRYVGKTSRGIEWRLQQHMSSRKSVRSSHWVHHLLALGYAPEAVELESGLSDTEWPEAEQFWIANFKMMGANLTNHTNGGHHIVKEKGMKPYLCIPRQSALALAKASFLHGTEYKLIWAIFDCMLTGRMAVQKELASFLGMSRPQVSASLKTLVQCNVVKVKQVGRVVFYEAHPQLAIRHN